MDIQNPSGTEDDPNGIRRRGDRAGSVNFCEGMMRGLATVQRGSRPAERTRQGSQYSTVREIGIEFGYEK